jgi:hypothetical protein
LFPDGRGIKAFGSGGVDDLVAYKGGNELTEDGVDRLIVGDFFKRLGKKRVTFLSIDVILPIQTRTLCILIRFVIFNIIFIIHHGTKTKDIKDIKDKKGQEEDKDEKKKKKEKYRILPVFGFKFRFIDDDSHTKRPILF